MELVVRDTQRALTVSKTIFGSDFNEALVYQVVVAYAAGSRQGTRGQKSRAEVTGSGKKPWRQKGTGRARSGSNKSPIWRSGGVTFAAGPQDHTKKVNKKMYRSALKSILSELLRQGRLIVVDEFFLDIPKTKLLVKKLKEMSLDSVLIISDKINRSLSFAARNLHKVDLCDINGINPVRLLAFDKVLMTANTVKQVEERLL